MSYNPGHNIFEFTAIEFKFDLPQVKWVIHIYYNKLCLQIASRVSKRRNT